MIHKALEVQTGSAAQDIKQLGGSSALLLGSEVMILGRYLISLRKNKSVRQAAEGIGISHTYLNKLEKEYDPRTGNKCIPSVITIYQISIYYKVPSHTLFSICIEGLRNQTVKL